MSEFWNKMYDGEEYIYGENPNDFFAESLVGLKPGKILLVADGEGRNGIFASKKGWEVFCFDVSEVGKNKALKLAEKNNTEINYIISDFKNLDYPKNSFDCIVLTFTHFINHKKQEFKKYLDKYLKVDGIVILEGFSKNHLGRQCGPKNIDMLFDIETLKNDFKNYEIISLEEKKVTLDEGKGHYGESIVVRFIGKKG